MLSVKDKVEKLIDSQNLKHRPVGLFAIDFEFYEIAKILHNNGIFPAAIVSPFDNNSGKRIMGIAIYSIKEFSYQYPNSVIILRMNDYFCNKSELLQLGYKINNNLFIDCEIKSIYFLSKLYIKSHGTGIFVQQIKAKIKGLTRYGHCFYDQWHGYKVYRKIRSHYPDVKMPIYVYDYSGMGDVYVFCLYLHKNYNIIAPSGLILTVIGKVSKKITDMFQISNVEQLSKKDSEFLTHFARLVGTKLNLIPMTPFPSHLHTDIYSHFLLGKRLNMADAYRLLMFNLNENVLKYPNNDENSLKKAGELFAKNNLILHKTIIISPYANTIIGYSQEFWLPIINDLHKMGFLVCTNCTGREPPLPNTVPLAFPLEIAEQILTLAGYFLGLRSGFCDVICNSEAFKCIIYPDYPIFNSNVYEFCSFSKMGIGYNIKEICWEYSDLSTLQKIIINSFKNAKIARTILKTQNTDSD